MREGGGGELTTGASGGGAADRVGLAVGMEQRTFSASSPARTTTRRKGARRALGAAAAAAAALRRRAAVGTTYTTLPSGVSPSGGRSAWVEASRMVWLVASVVEGGSRACVAAVAVAAVWHHASRLSADTNDALTAPGEGSGEGEAEGDRDGEREAAATSSGELGPCASFTGDPTVASAPTCAHHPGTTQRSVPGISCT